MNKWVEEKKFETVCLSSLEKVFADEELTAKPFQSGSALLNETYSFQVAYRYNVRLDGMRVRVESDLADRVHVRSVGLVPAEYPMHQDRGEIKNLLRDTPGLYPDPLYEIDEKLGLRNYTKQWRSIWVTVDVDENTQTGKHDIKIIFETEAGKALGSETFTLEVLPAKLPPQKLIHTEWFHADCLAVYYNDEVFSEAHWERIDQFLQTAVKHGVNMILTPLFTLPLDTEVGGERPTHQLVDVVKEGSTYKFGYDRLTRWIELCQARGIKYFEMSHLFTQWGAAHAPKIIATVNGEEKRIFGWDTDAAGEEYTHFLHQFLPDLIAYIKSKNLENNVYFHVSDEPKIPDLESYRKAKEVVADLLKDFPVIDALSNVEFYKYDLVQRPIPANNHIDDFLEAGVPDLWTYYCTSQFNDVSNRFFSFPSSRNRIIGMQLFKFDIVGFLHWGYNFWFSQFSKKAIDPFRVTDAGGAFPAGDPFLVYPGEDGPIESIRMEVFYDALQDLRALQLLESLVGKEKVMALIEEGLGEEITFSKYPMDAEWLLQKREQINQAIVAASK